MLNLDCVHLSYAQHAVLKGISLHLKQGEIGCLLGPSGCGKSSLLQCIAGFQQPQQGQISLEHQHFKNSRAQWLAAEQRGIGVVFQDYALFPHLTVAENICFGLYKQPKAQQQARCERLLELVNLTDWAKHYPHQLSGGQQQRVALARALAPRPKLVLMDEPFSNLDVSLKESLSLDCRRILKEEGMSALVVTHDQYEAFAMADVIGVMQDGQIQQWDSAYKVYHQPRSAFVANFVGSGVLLEGVMQSANQVCIPDLGLLAVQSAHDPALKHGQAVSVLMRPDDIIHNDESPLKAKVLSRIFRGANYYYRLMLPQGAQLLAIVPSHHQHDIGEWIGIQLDVEHVVVFASDIGV